MLPHVVMRRACTARPAGRTSNESPIL
jgi:hypothetical protein